MEKHIFHALPQRACRYSVAIKKGTEQFYYTTSRTFTGPSYSCAQPYNPQTFSQRLNFQHTHTHTRLYLL